MASKYKNADKSNTQHLLTKQSMNFWVTGGALLLFFLIMPFQRGLLNVGEPIFEVSILYSFLIGAVLLFCLSIHLFRSNNTLSFGTPYQYLIWSVPFFYFISMFGAASAHYSYIEFLIWVFYAIFFMAAYRFSLHSDGRNIAFYIYMITAAVIVLFGMMNWFGNASLWGLLPWEVYKDAAMFASGDIRLTSVFQYANTYAAYLIAFLYACIATIIFSRNKYIVLFASFMFVPSFISFILTLSRGGWLAFPVILILILPLISFTKQIQALFHFVLGAVVSIFLLSYINSTGLKLQIEHTQLGGFTAWIVLIGVSLIVAIISLFFQMKLAPKLDQKFARLNQHKLNTLFLPVLTIIIGVLGAILLFGNTGILKILPENIGSRLENINFNQHSVLERGTFYEDTITIWKDYPITGAGGGAWQALYQKYQHNPYTSILAHSFFFQMLTEIGLLGMIALFIVLMAIYYRFIRAFTKKTDEDKLVPYVWFLVCTSILIHSLLDFNMSYVYIGVLVFFALGGMLASTESKTFDWQKKLLGTKWKLVLPIVMATGAIMFFFSSIQNISGYNAYQDAQKTVTTAPIEKTMLELDKAINRSGHPEYVDYKLQYLRQLYDQTGDEQYTIEAQLTLDKVMKREPYYESFIYRQLELNKVHLDDEASTQLLSASMDKFPWEIKLYQEYAAVQFRRSIAALENDEQATAKELLQTIFDLRDKVNEKNVILEQLPEDQLQGRVFGITPALALPIGQSYYVLGDYENAIAYLSIAWNPAFTEQKDITAAVYYAAALKRLDRPYEEIEQALYTALPEQQEELQQRLSAISNAPPIAN